MNKLIFKSSYMKRSNKASAVLVALVLTVTVTVMPLKASWAKSESVNLSANLGKTNITDGFSNLVRTVSPAVVSISVTNNVKQDWRYNGLGQQSLQMNEFLRRYFGDLPEFRSKREHGYRPKRHKERTAGSGFIIDADGFVVTNYHVVEDADEIEVVFSDGTRLSATLKGKDQKTDLALLEINTDQKLPYVEFGDSNNAHVGDWVIAIGNPFGLGGTTTSGIISARGRDLRSGSLDDFIQIDAPINLGNSGGPLFNTLGQVIGVNSAIYSPNGGSVGIGFAIPSSTAENVIGQLKNTGTVERGYLGVQIQSIDNDLADTLGLKKAEGALVAEVVKNSPADKSGLKSGDVIIQYNERKIEKMRDLPKFVALTQQGRKVSVKVWRDGAYKTLTVKVGDKDAQIIADTKEIDNKLGVVLSEMNQNIARKFRIDPEATGVVIIVVEPDSIAAERGLRPGDIVKRVGRTTVETPQDVLDSIQSSKKKNKKSVLFLVERGRRLRFVALPFRA